MLTTTLGYHCLYITFIHDFKKSYIFFLKRDAGLLSLTIDISLIDKIIDKVVTNLYII